MITGITHKRPKKESLSDAISGAAVAFVKAMKSTSDEKASDSSQKGDEQNLNVNQLGISPEKSADLRMKNLQQLRYLQQLHNDNILSDTEFLEQKGIILDALRKL